MKRNNFFSLAMLVMMLTTLLSAHASTLENAISQMLQLQVRYDDPVAGNLPFPKSPVQVPEVYIDGYTLTFDTSCDGCTLRIVNAEDEVEYTTIITSSTLVLPATLEGNYEIQIVRDNWCFYGDIEL